MDHTGGEQSGGVMTAERSNVSESIRIRLGSLLQMLARFFYDISYQTGVQTLRLFRNFRRRAAVWAKAFAHSASEQMHYRFTKFRVLAREWDICVAVDRFLDDLRGIRADGAIVASKALRFTGKYSWKLLATILNHVCPVLAIALLVSTVKYFTTLPLALEVEYDGEKIGYIMDESVFDEAESMVRNRIIYEEYEEPEDAVPKFTLTVADESRLSDSYSIADQIIRYSGNEIVQADGLYIDDKFVGATTDGDSMMLLLEDFKEPYLEQYPDAKVEFTSKIRVREGLYPVSSVVELANIEEYLSSEVEGEKIYIAQAGDAPYTIARSNGLALAELLEMNPGIDKKLLVGQEVLISRSQPLLGVKATVVTNYTEEVAFKINRTIDPSQYSTYSKVTKTGENGLREVEEELVYINGSVAERNIISSEMLVEPVNQEITVGSKSLIDYYGMSAGTATSNGSIWPVGGRGGYVSCSLWGYYGHTGMDIAGVPIGTPIYATAAGTVIVSQQRPGYGKYIIIDHGGGLQTYYLHCSALYVSPGQKVNQGQTIAALGNTGNSTGPHLHIEFRVNGAVKNPASYIGTR